MSQLYLISPPAIDLETFPALLDRALKTGKVAAFQLRLKHLPDAGIIQAAEALLPICRYYDIPFILNDRVDLAHQLKADGVHLGASDGNVTQAREILGQDAVIGVSCYDSRDLAIKGAEEGADYVSFGAFFPTKTKETTATPPLEILKWWSEWTVVPCVAIGGITADNCRILVESGADFLAVISYVWEHPEGVEAAVGSLSVQL